MKIEITGQSLDEYMVEVSDDQGRTETFNVQALLNIDEESLEQEVSTCAAVEHFWQQVAIDADKEAEEFERVSYAQFEAHCDRFARYYIKGLGEKVGTEKAKDKAAVLIFSEKADQSHFSSVAYKGYEEECRKVGVKPKAQMEFDEEMYSFPTFEETEQVLLALQYKAKHLRAVASAFNAKAWSVKTKAADLRASKEATR